MMDQYEQPVTEACREVCAQEMGESRSREKWARVGREQRVEWFEGN